MATVRDQTWNSWLEPSLLSPLSYNHRTSLLATLHIGMCMHVSLYLFTLVTFCQVSSKSLISPLAYQILAYQILAHQLLLVYSVVLTLCTAVSGRVRPQMFLSIHCQLHTDIHKCGRFSDSGRFPDTGSFWLCRWTGLQVHIDGLMKGEYSSCPTKEWAPTKVVPSTMHIVITECCCLWRIAVFDSSVDCTV